MTARNEFVSDPGGGRDTVRAVARVDPPGIELHDDIHGHSESLVTPEPVSLSECDTDPFCFPVDRAYHVTFPDGCSPAITIPKLANIFVMDEDAQQVAEAVNFQSVHVPPGEWTVDFGSVGIKMFLAVDGRIGTDVEDEQRRLFFTDADGIRIGLRSLHERPSTTVHVGTSPRAIMRAISCFGSVLKTHSAERSFPTLRGHPPLVEVDTGAHPDWFDAPPDLERTPDATDILIRVPERLDAVYPITSLAYYLNAAVVPGDPVIVAGDRSVPLTGNDAPGDSVAESATRVLEQVFTLDCVTRTEGFFRVELGERNLIESVLESAGESIDWSELYGRSLPDRVARYLALPYDVVAPAVPRWPVTAHIEPTPERAAFLPFIADELGTIYPVENTVTAGDESTSMVQRAAVTDFLRDRSESDPTYSEDVTVDDGGAAAHEPGEHTVTVPRTAAITDLWCAPGHPVGGVEPTIDACRRRLVAQPSGTIDVAVISNSPAMRDEADVTDLYGVRELLKFDVSMYEDLSEDALRAVLASDHDLVHFVGHVSRRGLQTSDGWLDTSGLPSEAVNVRAFVLNACRSYAQGRALVDAGAIGGLCTVSPVGNAPATEVGRAVARLLNVGFTLSGALDLIRERNITGRQYSIVGDPRITVAEGRGGTPFRLHVEQLDPDRYRAVIHGYPSPSMNLGTIFTSHLGTTDTQYLNSGRITEVTVTRAELDKYLSLVRVPVTVENDETLYWSDQLDVATINAGSSENGA